MNLLVIFSTLLLLSEARSWFPPVWSKDCSYTREDSFKCLEKYVDVDPKDGQITPKEVKEALDKYLPSYLKPMFWFIGISKIFEDCDYDHNGVITPRDWMLSEKKCMHTKESWCTMQWFCEGAQS